MTTNKEALFWFICDPKPCLWPATGFRAHVHHFPSSPRGHGPAEPLSRLTEAKSRVQTKSCSPDVHSSARTTSRNTPRINCSHLEFTVRDVRLWRNREYSTQKTLERDPQDYSLPSHAAPRLLPLRIRCRGRPHGSPLPRAQR
uniref:Uncharacterized protein n=1 Tax=Molossus molossus TaxID=27622 RepID=A0A7J8F948_MOLMO|nr:hypothetical protein HJG59_008500 [Molossus molossus]